jgi:hypothetical protein
MFYLWSEQACRLAFGLGSDFCFLGLLSVTICLVERTEFMVAKGPIQIFPSQGRTGSKKKTETSDIWLAAQEARAGFSLSNSICRV